MIDRESYNHNNSVLFVTNYRPNVGGISGQVEILSESLSTEGVKTKIFNTGCSLMRPLFFFPLLFEGRHYTIIHIHGCSNLGGFYPIMLGTLVGKILKRKIIVTYHGGGAKKFFSKYLKLIQPFFNLANHITVPSDFLLKTFKEYGFKPLVIPNILRSQRGNFRIRNKIKPVLIVTRALNKIYNVECAINAFKLVQKRYKNSKLIIVGDGKEMKNLMRLVKILNLRGVNFVGRIPNDDIFLELDKADIFINPTTQDNMPVSLLEALACGLVVISTNVGGVPFIIKDKVNGLLVENNDCVKIANRVNELIENNELAKRLIVNGKNTIENYSWNKIKYNLCDIYGMDLDQV